MQKSNGNIEHDKHDIMRVSRKLVNGRKANKIVFTFIHVYYSRVSVQHVLFDNSRYQFRQSQSFTSRFTRRFLLTESECSLSLLEPGQKKGIPRLESRVTEITRCI